MAKVESSTKLPIPAQVVWNLVGQFNALPEWHPAIQSSEIEHEGDAKIRKLKLAGGGELVERLEEMSDSERRYSYSILESPLPIANYQATISVKGDDAGGCTVSWSSEFDADGANESEAVETVRNVYEAGFENLKRMFGG